MDCCQQSVPVSSHAFRGVQKHIVHLKEPLLHADLATLMRDGRFCMSADGKTAARLVPDNSRKTVTLLIDHEPIVGATFCNPSRTTDNRPRVLDTSLETALIWGKREGSRHAGLYSCSKSGIETIFERGELVGVQSTSSGVLVFVKKPSDPTHMRRLLSPHNGLELKIHDGAVVTPLSDDALLIVEPVDGILRRYVVSPSGFADMFPIPLERCEHFVGLVRWRDNYLLATRGGYGSRFQSLGPFDREVGDRIISIAGCVERVWQSPSEKTLVCLSRVRLNSGVVRALFVNGRVVRQGEFFMGQNDLIWSPDGTVPAARIRAGMDGSGTQTLIAPQGEIAIPSGLTASEFLVDNNGNLAARIETDGEFDHPYVYNEPPHTTVTSAWNLHWSARGEISYTCVLGQIVVAITDQTHLRR